MTRYLWSLRFRNSAFPVPIWGRHNKTNATHIDRWCRELLQLRWTFFCNEHTRIKSSFDNSEKITSCCKRCRLAYSVIACSSLKTIAQKTLPISGNLTAIINYTKEELNFYSVLSCRQVEQRTDSTWNQHRRPPNNMPERYWGSEQPTFVQCISGRQTQQA